MTTNLSHPWNNELPFNINLFYFLAPFDIMERGDEWNEALCKIDINDDHAVSKLAFDYLLTGRLVDDFSPEHKWEVLRGLIEPLSSDSFDFQEIFSDTALEQEGIALPTTWQVADARRFFEVLYEVHYNSWHSDVANYDPPSPQDLCESSAAG